jgi:hypothetical protein
MRIDKPGQNDPTTAIDFSNPLPIVSEPWIAKSAFRAAHCDDLARKAEYRSIVNDAEFGKGTAASRAANRRTQGHKLPDVD